MKIADYSLSMQSSHVWSEQTSVQETLRVRIDPPPPPPSATVSLSGTAQHKQASETAAAENSSQSVTNDPKLLLLISMIERLTGQKVRIFDASQLNNPHADSSPASAPPPAPPRAGYSLDYSKVSSYSVSEQTSMQASGVIKTSDGKEIQFNLSLSMQYQYSETSSTTLHMGDTPRKTDPLVINFNGTAAQLGDMRFAFDLNSDGTKENINAPAPGSGFLALDLNGDGKINNGSELFGPATGNGFGELARYDSDGNGWIDESDPVFQQLKVWMKDAGGNDKLSGLGTLGVGAISLQSIATPFDIKTAGNQLLGTVRSSSVMLNEDGSVGSVQQVDLTV